MGFINAEFARIGLAPVPDDHVLDTLALARRKHPMGPNSLDALCRRYGIDNTHRTKHGALLDSELLADVYIELIGGRQTALGFGGDDNGRDGAFGERVAYELPVRERPLKSRITSEEAEAHAKMVASFGDKALWAKYQN